MEFHCFTLILFYYLFIDLLAIYYSPMNFVFISFVHLFIGTLIFSIWIGMNSLHIKEISVSCITHIILSVYLLILSMESFLFVLQGLFFWFFAAWKFQDFLKNLNSQSNHSWFLNIMSCLVWSSSFKLIFFYLFTCSSRGFVVVAIVLL